MREPQAQIGGGPVMNVYLDPTKEGVRCDPSSRLTSEAEIDRTALYGTPIAFGSVDPVTASLRDWTIERRDVSVPTETSEVIKEAHVISICIGLGSKDNH